MTTITPPTGDTRVYVSTPRKGITAHRYADDPASTICGRSTRSGQALEADIAVGGYAVAWCEQCWGRPS